MLGFQQSGAIELSADYHYVFQSTGLCEFPDNFTLTPTPNVTLSTIDSSNKRQSFYMQPNGTFQQGYIYGLPVERYPLR